MTNQSLGHCKIVQLLLTALERRNEPPRLQSPTGPRFGPVLWIPESDRKGAAFKNVGPLRTLCPVTAIDRLGGGSLFYGAHIQSLVTEMDARYQAFSNLGATNIAEATAKGAKLPFIVAFIEELADLVMQDKTVEPLLVRLAQKARAAGIHLVLATQRPDAKTFSGLIRSNIPTRIALTVQKSSESIIILDEPGAEALLGMGDMLIRRPGDSQPVRGHGVYVSRADIEGYLKRLK